MIMNNNYLNEIVIEIMHAIAYIGEQLNSSTTDYDKLCSILLLRLRITSYELAKFIHPETVFISVN